MSTYVLYSVNICILDRNIYSIYSACSRAPDHLFLNLNLKKNKEVVLGHENPLGYLMLHTRVHTYSTYSTYSTYIHTFTANRAKQSKVKDGRGPLHADAVPQRRQQQQQRRRRGVARACACADTSAAAAAAAAAARKAPPNRGQLPAAEGGVGAPGRHPPRRLGARCAARRKHLCIRLEGQGRARVLPPKVCRCDCVRKGGPAQDRG